MDRGKRGLGDTGLPESYHSHDEWGRDKGSDCFGLRVSDFILPLEIQRKGVSTTFWSLVWRSLPKPPQGELYFSG